MEKLRQTHFDLRGALDCLQNGPFPISTYQKFDSKKRKLESCWDHHPLITRRSKHLLANPTIGDLEMYSFESCNGREENWPKKICSMPHLVAALPNQGKRTPSSNSSPLRSPHPFLLCWIQEQTCGQYIKMKIYDITWSDIQIPVHEDYNFTFWQTSACLGRHLEGVFGTMTELVRDYGLLFIVYQICMLRHSTFLSQLWTL